MTSEQIDNLKHRINGSDLFSADERAQLIAGLTRVARHIHYHCPPGSELHAVGEVVMIRPTEKEQMHGR